MAQKKCKYALKIMLLSIFLAADNSAKEGCLSVMTMMVLDDDVASSSSSSNKSSSSGIFRVALQHHRKKNLFFVFRTDKNLSVTHLCL